MIKIYCWEKDKFFYMSQQSFAGHDGQDVNFPEKMYLLISLQTYVRKLIYLCDAHFFHAIGVTEAL